MKVRVAEGVQALQFALKWRQRNFHRGGWALWQHLLTATPAAPLPGVKRTPSPDVSTKHKRLMQGQCLNPLPLHWTECTSILCQSPTSSHSPQGRGSEGSSGTIPLPRLHRALSQPEAERIWQPVERNSRALPFIKTIPKESTEVNGMGYIKPIYSFMTPSKGHQSFLQPRRMVR